MLHGIIESKLALLGGPQAVPQAHPDLVRGVPMGEGDLANADFLRGLRDGGFDGTVAYEMCSPLRGDGAIGNLDFCATRFLEWQAANG